MSNYRKGRNVEYRVKRKLQNLDFKVFRAAGSKPIDLIAVNDKDVFLIEVKSYVMTTAEIHKEIHKLWALCRGTIMRPLIVERWENGKLVFREFTSSEHETYCHVWPIELGRVASGMIEEIEVP